MFIDENMVDDMQELNVEAQDPDLEIGEDDEQGEAAIAVDDATSQEDATPAPSQQQTPEENAIFKVFRQESERRLSQKEQELQQFQSREQRLLSVLSDYGFSGDISEIADRLEAEKRSVAPDVIKQERLEMEQRMEREAQLALREQRLMGQTALRQMQDDLAGVRCINPNVKSLDDLGADFLRLRFAKDGSGAPLFATAQQAYVEWERRHHTKGTTGTSTPGTEHLVALTGAAAGRGLREIPASELEFYKDNFPKDTPAQLKERYNRILKRQGE